MSIALDIGAFQLRSLRRSEDRLIGRRCRAIMAVLPDSPSSIRLLHQARITYAACDEHLIVLGDDAVDLSRTHQASLIQLMPQGKFTPDDPLPRQALATLIEAAVPLPQRRREFCSLTLPGASALNNASPEREFVTRLLRRRGYSPRVISSGLALCLAELVDRGFTGVGVSFGAATCQASLCHRGMEIIRCTVPLGAEGIDERIARQIPEYNSDTEDQHHLNREAVRIRRENVQTVLPRGEDEFARLVARLYQEWVDEAIGELAAELNHCRVAQSIPQPIDVVIGGGITRVDGFRALVENSVGKAAFPVAIREIRVAGNPDYSIARGCLIDAALESNPGDNSLRAA